MGTGKGGGKSAPVNITFKRGADLRASF